ncbi:hypothetical protein AAFF_G00111250 [Aldrovandia affinis]|uniref:Uncharacterized protein n=1 Tax=Aldrovandia affinis TaxID=143900 RepID=A0AAD7RW57_9TELE|nr:hypothetical protein AAFF_G00111250 [Aldrovandia affinis]
MCSWCDLISAPSSNGTPRDELCISDFTAVLKEEGAQAVVHRVAPALTPGHTHYTLQGDTGGSAKVSRRRSHSECSGFIRSLAVTAGGGVGMWAEVSFRQFSECLKPQDRSVSTAD